MLTRNRVINHTRAPNRRSFQQLGEQIFIFYAYPTSDAPVSPQAQHSQSRTPRSRPSSSHPVRQSCLFVGVKRRGVYKDHLAPIIRPSVRPSDRPSGGGGRRPQVLTGAFLVAVAPGLGGGRYPRPAAVQQRDTLHRAVQTENRACERRAKAQTALEVSKTSEMSSLD